MSKSTGIKVNGQKVSKKTQLHDIVDWNIDNIRFSEPVEGSIPGSPLSFYRIYLLTLNHKLDDKGNIMMDANGVPLNDTSMGDLVFAFDKLFSFGVQESTSLETKAVTGHSVSLAMWNKDEPSQRELLATKKIEQIVEKCKEYMLDVKVKTGIKKPKLAIHHLEGLDKVLYWKTDKVTGDRIEGQGPTMSPKLVEYKERTDKDGKFHPAQMSSVFYLEDEVDSEGNPIEVNPLDYLAAKGEKKYMYIRPAVKFESIFVSGDKFSLQPKLLEADIQPVKIGTQRLLHGRHAVQSNNKISMSSSSVNPLLDADELDMVEAEEKTASLSISKSSPTTTPKVVDELNDDEDEVKLSDEKPKKKTITKKKKEASE